MKLNEVVEKVKVVDGFKIPLKHDIEKIEGGYFEKTIFGFYKIRYLRLTHHELYLYSNEHSN